MLAATTHVSLFGLVISFVSVSLQQDICRDTTALCLEYKKYCYGNVLAACRLTCNMCPPASYKGRCEFEYSGCGQLCQKIADRVECSCLPGYRLNFDRKTCSDIDECAELLNPCSRTKKPFCINTRGSYFCSAKERCDTRIGYFNYYKSNSCCKLKTESCGQSIATIGRIVGGTEASAGRWPWMCRLEHKGFVVCGGALISPHVILTAAHCLRYKYTEYTIMCGDTKRRVPTAELATFSRTRKIKQIIFHEDYRFPNHDIAIVRLNSELKTTDFISPVCLPNGEVPKPGWKCWTMGFGNTDYSIPRPNHLREVDLNIVSRETCSIGYGQFINENTICAGYKEGGKDTCFGDSGGPLVCQRCRNCQWYVAGVTSFGRGCAEPGLYGVYTNVAAHEKWIRYHAGLGPSGCGGDELGIWSSWSPYTPCNASCSQEGFKYRYKDCTTPNGEETCAESRRQSKKCLGTCQQWSIWGPWSGCTNSCGGGIQVRNRLCVGELEGEPGCEGEPYESKACNTLPCAATQILDPDPDFACYHAQMDKVDNCDTMVDLCEGYSTFMRPACEMTCCLNSLGEGSKICEDNPGSKALCEKHKEECNNPLYGNYFKDNCKATCNFC